MRRQVEAERNMSKEQEGRSLASILFMRECGGLRKCTELYARTRQSMLVASVLRTDETNATGGNAASCTSSTAIFTAWCRVSCDLHTELDSQLHS